MDQPGIVILLVKLAVAASFASILVRFTAFKQSLLNDQRDIVEQLRFAFSISFFFGGGVAVRVITGTYGAADLGLEGSLITGLAGGYVPGLVAGTLISLPAMWNGELLSMPLFAGIGVLGGVVRDMAPDPEEIWRFSPFLDRNLIRVIRKRSDRALLSFHLAFLVVLVSLELCRVVGRFAFPNHALFTLFPLEGAHLGRYAAAWLTTLLAVLLPLKIWNNARTEQKLEMQQRLTQEARLRALTSQINPHFLFNTLNSIASLVRTNPELARKVILKLSSILRRLLRKNEPFSPLRDELAFIDDYLSIEIVRFGEKLRFIKDIEPDALEISVPSMLLQPIIENSLKHGISSKVEGGTIRLVVKTEEKRLTVLIEDDGVGIPEANLAKLFQQGIGVSNVNERLQVLFGSDYRMWVDSQPGEGTRTGMEFPVAAPAPSSGTSPHVTRP